MGRRDRGTDERGAVAVFTAGVMVVLIAVAALVVDIGVQRVARTDMQTLADMVALDLSRELDGRTVAQLQAGSPSLIQKLANESQARNKGTVGDPPTVTPVLGRLSSLGSFVEMTSGTDVPTAVRVVASTTVDFAFGLARSGGASRSATATSGAGACYRVSSFALGLATKDSVLRGLLGGPASLRVLSNAGIANANVSLLGIATELGVGTPQELVNLPNLTVGQFITAAANVLNAQGDTASVDLATQLLGLKSDIGPLASSPAALGQLLAVGQGGASALTAGINVFDIVTGAAQVANGQNAINVPELALKLGLADATASLYLTSPARQACNGAVARSTQGYIRITGELGSCNKLLSVLCTTVSLTVNLANASARLSPSWVCTPDNLTLSVSDQKLANIRLEADIRQYVLGVLLKVASVDTGAPPSGPTKDYDLPLPASYSQPGVETSSGTLGLSLAGADVTLLGLVSVGPVLALLNPLVAAVGDVLVPNLLSTLGLTLNGADLTAVPTVTCANPRLTA